ncbi:MAG TPA: GNAT family N-acetyltransferase [Caulobacteraceae bacterium]|jgi:phosphinothricin acetyltransferase|nr:GNAT family N-acetyltransferase [Caulobacteraceae bacterium]
MIVRDAEARDHAPMLAIYAHHVLSGLGSFEEAPPDAADFTQRMAAIARLGLPCLVAESAGAIAGYGYASAYRPRIGYRYTVEDSVYVAPGHLGQGVGRALLQGLIERCTAKRLRQMMAFIGDSGNAPSVALHRACGFEAAGILRSIGFRHGRWVDVVVMQRALAQGDTEPPEGPGWVAG